MVRSAKRRAPTSCLSLRERWHGEAVTERVLAERAATWEHGEAVTERAAMQYEVHYETAKK